MPRSEPHLAIASANQPAANEEMTEHLGNDTHDRTSAATGAGNVGNGDRADRGDKVREYYATGSIGAFTA